MKHRETSSPVSPHRFLLTRCRWENRKKNSIHRTLVAESGDLGIVFLICCPP